MTTMKIRVEEPVEEGVRLGVEPCACGRCHPTATAYEGDPHYERHDPALAEGPCCCGRFFVLAATPHAARARAEAMAERFRADGMAKRGYAFETQRMRLPWGEGVTAIVADLAAEQPPRVG